MHIVRSTLIVSIVTFASRLIGYLRDVMIASILGAGPMNDGFLVAFRLANLFRSLFGEGAFHSAFIPIFAGLIKRRSIHYAKAFASRVQSLLFLSLFCFCVVALLSMRFIVEITTPGLTFDNSEYLNFITELARITFPYLLLISMVAFYGGVLNSISKFFPFASISILFNITLITFLLCRSVFKTTAHALCYGLLVAGIIELIWIIYFAKRNDVIIPIKKPKINSKIKTMLKRMTAGMFGAGILQVNILIDMVIASFIPGGISFLYFADKIMQLPLAVIGTASSLTLLPTLAKSFQVSNFEDANATQNSMLKFTMFFAIPSCFGIIYLAFEIVDLLFHRGAFTYSDTLKTAAALQFFALGLPAYVLNKIFISYLHSKGDVKTPVTIGAICLILNACFSVALVIPLQHSGIALSSSIVAFINSAMLMIGCYKYSGYKIDIRSIFSLIYSMIAALIMVISLYVLQSLQIVNSKILGMLFLLASAAICYIVSYFAIFYAHKFVTTQIWCCKVKSLSARN